MRHIVSGVLGHPAMPMVQEGGLLVILEPDASVPVHTSEPGKAFLAAADLAMIAVEVLWQSGVRVILSASQVEGHFLVHSSFLSGLTLRFSKRLL